MQEESRGDIRESRGFSRLAGGCSYPIAEPRYEYKYQVVLVLSLWRLRIFHSAHNKISYNLR